MKILKSGQPNDGNPPSGVTNMNQEAQRRLKLAATVRRLLWVMTIFFIAAIVCLYSIHTWVLFVLVISPLFVIFSCFFLYQAIRHFIFASFSLGLIYLTTLLVLFGVMRHLEDVTQEIKFWINRSEYVAEIKSSQPENGHRIKRFRWEIPFAQSAVLVYDEKDNANLPTQDQDKEWRDVFNEPKCDHIRVNRIFDRHFYEIEFYC